MSDDSLWFREDAAVVRRPRLSRERIVTAAVGLLDAEGMTGFSMRRLAARLDAGTMSLYGHVSSREDVLDLALDAVFDEIPLPAPGTPWRAVLTAQLVESRRMMRRHPWVPALRATRPLLGPIALAHSECFYAALADAGLTGPSLIAAVNALTSYAHGHSAAENVWRTTVRDPEQEAELRRRVQDHLSRRADRYPTLAAHAQVEYADFDGSFELGLELVLDGIEARLPPVA
ncbi:TetR family transcriptional regulator [Streptomyces sp. 8K308]|uniref:TetR/AcrR family transcriptional regulator n=1 Tax=Streptomyces sp. 8K308 TaxID=2530388 RepID=UPI001051A78B|nr:TetR/AcrR family transcriptional regulator C-terminal domain-containing protein [Streptomyces sp. 8K308]TDC25357.1 TetR family transcriptional regulator [Streptomyces sp. 8K308]